jgi:type IV/VI secretion system ImpK/VasF family protein
MLSGGGERASSAGILPVDPALLERLRDELLGCLEVLDEKLSKELPESEVQLVLFPLVLLCDELVMVRLPKEQHTHWHLLQADLFQINYGGDVFYEFADEHLGKETSPGIVFEVLYYCLSAGFVGRFGLDTGKVKRYRGLLSERIQKHVDTAAEAKPAEKLDAPSLVGPRRSRHRSVGTAERRSRAVTLSYYVVAVLVASLCIATLAVFTNF